MEVFDPTPPEWIDDTVHARDFCCPQCQAGPAMLYGLGSIGDRRW